MTNHRPLLPVRVLIIDDAAEIRTLDGIYLEHVGFHIEAAADGREGLKKAHRMRPDVIVLDLSLPDIDGWSVCRVLKHNPLTRAIPIIAYSGLTDMKSRDRAQEAGVAGFLTKPCSPEDLIAEIQRHVPNPGLPP